jgi:hypothetical protein
MTEQEQKLKDFLMMNATITEMDNIRVCLEQEDFNGADKIITEIMERIEK